jgi:hypothetical protein
MRNSLLTSMTKADAFGAAGIAMATKTTKTP